ncbi:hypothetical protein GALMADRAFT_232960 [Galerina marginata CBS 339.88]|uniref:MYND-type domain-containing protein n=1 Tax=Galerina marginata (strain CBS 339.88) TaxID=685588 RepID=A0A067SEU9_GALM3|nr:hypothetical protein GALMADRAFT_232960 [Galerina marginata CBS 339.88]
MHTGVLVPSAGRRCFQCFDKRSRSFLCAGCNRAFYCNKACQLKHRKLHRPYCHGEKLSPDLSLGVAWLESNKTRVVRIALGLLLLDAAPDASRPYQERMRKVMDHANTWAACFTLVMLQVDPRLPAPDQIVIDTTAANLFDCCTISEVKYNTFDAKEGDDFEVHILLKVHSFNDANYGLESRTITLRFNPEDRLRDIPPTQLDIKMELQRILHDGGIAGLIHNIMLQLRSC